MILTQSIRLVLATIKKRSNTKDFLPLERQFFGCITPNYFQITFTQHLRTHFEYPDGT
nr:MAG TPA: hypothetical protein [Caudoviricetes sp.]